MYQFIINVEIHKRPLSQNTVITSTSLYTVDSRYFDFKECFEISVPRHIRFAELRKTINRTTTFNKRIYNFSPEIKIY